MYTYVHHRSICAKHEWMYFSLENNSSFNVRRILKSILHQAGIVMIALYMAAYCSCGIRRTFVLLCVMFIWKKIFERAVGWPHLTYFMPSISCTDRDYCKLYKLFPSEFSKIKSSQQNRICYCVLAENGLTKVLTGRRAHKNRTTIYYSNIDLSG